MVGPEKTIGLASVSLLCFLRSSPELRSQILSLPSVYSFVTFGSEPAAIAGSEIEGIRRAVNAKSVIEPHTFLKRGDWVRVTSGPLADMEGILVRKKSSYRLVLSVNLLQKSIAIEVDGFCVSPIPQKTLLLAPTQTDPHARVFEETQDS